MKYSISSIFSPLNLIFRNLKKINNEKYKNIKKRIRNKLRIYIEAIIYSYIYCLNELSDEDDYDEQFFYQFIK